MSGDHFFFNETLRNFTGVPKNKKPDEYLSDGVIWESDGDQMHPSMHVKEEVQRRTKTTLKDYRSWEVLALDLFS